jgi:hypothetical protein
MQHLGHDICLVMSWASNSFSKKCRQIWGILISIDKCVNYSAANLLIHWSSQCIYLALKDIWGSRIQVDLLCHKLDLGKQRKNEELSQVFGMLMFFRQSELLNTVPRLSNVHFKVGWKDSFLLWSEVRTHFQGVIICWKINKYREYLIMLKHFSASQTTSPAARQFLVHLDWSYYICERMILIYMTQCTGQQIHSMT